MSDRVLLVKIKAKPFDIATIQVYASTSESEEEECDSFYADLDKAYKQCKSNEIVIVIGDINVKVDSERVGLTIDPFGLVDKNDYGEIWIEWCQGHDQIITNMWFKQHPRRIYIYIYIYIHGKALAIMQGIKLTL